MTTKQRDRRFRRAQMNKDTRPRKGGAKIERTPRTEAYDRNKRVNVRADLNTKWGWL